jgi:hypothetical protein
VLRVFGEQQVGGIVTGWMPPNPQDVSEPVLFHVKPTVVCHFRVTTAIVDWQMQDRK